MVVNDSSRHCLILATGCDVAGDIVAQDGYLLPEKHGERLQEI